MSPKNLKNTVLHPRKPQFGWGKTMGCEKPLFLQENMKTIIWDSVSGWAWCRWHCFLQGKSKILIVFCSKKNHSSGVHFGSIQGPPEHQTLFFARNLHDFTKCVFEAQKWPKTSRCKPRWLQVTQSWPQIAHPHSTQFVCVIARSFCQYQTSKLS